MDNRTPAQQRNLTFEELVALERKRQDEKWGEQNHSPAWWLAILVEEIGELAQAILRHGWGGLAEAPPEIEKELIQCASVCKVMWESGKRNGWL